MAKHQSSTASARNAYDKKSGDERSLHGMRTSLSAATHVHLQTSGSSTSKVEWQAGLLLLLRRPRAVSVLNVHEVYMLTRQLPSPTLEARHSGVGFGIDCTKEISTAPYYIPHGADEPFSTSKLVLTKQHRIELIYTQSDDRDNKENKLIVVTIPVYPVIYLSRGSETHRTDEQSYKQEELQEKKESTQRKS
ncbi:hypothetical protein BC629DRAFT_1442258 [Irpex lacteus]|nr:hypothetical protein BC629DRAFT_1442258 [Irpex lacteus]